MKIVIDIPEEKYEEIKKVKDFRYMTFYDWEGAIIKGVILPKGHGRLIDADKLEESFNDCYGECGICRYNNETGCDLVYKTQTVIEADNKQDFEWGGEGD